VNDPWRAGLTINAIPRSLFRRHETTNAWLRTHIRTLESVTSELATIATKFLIWRLSDAISIRIKTDDSSNRLPGIESKRDTGEANLRPTYGQRGVKSLLLRQHNQALVKS